MRIGAAYIRVSTDDQLEYSPDAQLREIKNYAAKHNIILNDKYIFLDEGITGRSTKKRDEFNKMIGLSKQTPKPFDVILLWKFSRFARNQEESIVYKSMLRKQLGIDVESVSEPLIDGPFGSLIERIIEWMDEYYSINLSGEVVRGMTEKALRGEIQSTPSFGYDKAPGQPMTVNETEAKYVQYIFERYLGGTGITTLARILNDMGVKTKRGNPIENRFIKRLLSNQVYIGRAVWNGINKQSDFKPIISEDLFNQVQEKLHSEHKAFKKNDKPKDVKKHYLSGLVKCGNCGATMSYSKIHDGFQCIGYTKGKCGISHFIQASKLEQAIIEYLSDIDNKKEYELNVRPFVNDDLVNEKELLIKEQQRYRRMFENAKLAFLEGIDTSEEYSANKTKLTALVDDLQAKIDEIKEPAVDNSQLVKKVKGLVKVLNLTDNYKKDYFNAKYDAIRGCVERVEFSRPGELLKIFFYL
ncbi:recombinase family protein [Aminipila butyrica]|uniref:Recombinase family protein n=1 Tax=Aminipila butyrica TaxID=433296 RepID=A0A858BUG1_9FIRM|nr:recombinase family protein [Aminipila butyrica]QIB68580.1 recombinase family protein [Aminipila butyrica]